jgi:hypothetical protein
MLVWNKSIDAHSMTGWVSYPEWLYEGVNKCIGPYRVTPWIGHPVRAYAGAELMDLCLRGFLGARNQR